MDVSTYIQEGGVMMYVILLLQFPSLFVGIGTLGYAWMKRYEVRSGPSVWALPAAASALGLIVIGVGLIGYEVGMSNVQSALELVADDKMRRAMQREGERLASYPAIYGSIIGAPTLVAGVMGAFMTWRRPTK